MAMDPKPVLQTAVSKTQQRDKTPPIQDTGTILHRKALMPRSPPVSQSPSPGRDATDARRGAARLEGLGLDGFRLQASGQSLQFKGLEAPFVYGRFWASMGLYGALLTSMGLYKPLSMGLYGAL